MVSNQTRSADSLKLTQYNTQVLTYERKKDVFELDLYFAVSSTQCIHAIL